MSTPAATLTGREAAYRAVRDVLAGKGFASTRLHALRRDDRLAGREAGLAMEIALGSIRHVITIAHVLGAVARFEERRTNVPLRSVLYTAAFQLIWMDRIPEFAAVDAAVDLARRHVRGRAPGMVNAVLRKLVRAIASRRACWQPKDPCHIRVDWTRACAFNVPVLPAASSESERAAHLAAAAGERDGRFAVLVERFGAQQAEMIAWASQAVPPTVLHRNPLRIDLPDFRDRVRKELGDAALWRKDAAFAPPDVSVVQTRLFREGLASIQDATAHRAALLVEPRPGERLLDWCAAPGGKAAVLAQQMDDRGEVLACDVSAERLERVHENAARLGLNSIRPVLLAPDSPESAELRGEFDAAIVDAPCSNTGAIARRPEARLGLTLRKLASLRGVQSEVLRQAALHVRPGGRLVYSTCSIEPQENERIVEAFLSEFSAWRLDQQWIALPAWGPALDDWRDGGFAARLLRTS